MKTLTASLFLLTAMAAGSVQAQTKAPSKPVAKATPPKTAATARPAVKPAAKPATTTRPATAAAPKPAAPAPAPASAPTTAPAPTPPASTGELFREGTTMINLGVGLGLGYAGYYGTLKSTPAISISAERGIKEGIGPGVIGVGALIGYKAYHYDYPGTSYKATWTNLLVSVRGTYHYNVLQNPKLDTYGGVSLGVRMQKWKDTQYDNTPGLQGYSTSSTYVTSGIFVGARYFLTDNIGAFTEVGYDMSYLKLGVTARF